MRTVCLTVLVAVIAAAMPPVVASRPSCCSDERHCPMHRKAAATDGCRMNACEGDHNVALTLKAVVADTIDDHPLVVLQDVGIMSLHEPAFEGPQPPVPPPRAAA